MLIATVLTAAAVVAPTTLPATNVTATGATLNGTVDESATVRFEYDAKASGPYELATPNQAVTSAGDVSATIAGLTPETKYRYRIVAGGETGNEQTFTTTANPQPPAIANQHSREITPDAATTTATVNANGSATTYTIEWGTTTRYGSQTAAASAGNGRTPTAVTARLTGLNPYTLYHWRAVATNAAGTTRGRDRTFRTARLPSTVTIGLSRRTVPWGGDVRIGGRVIGVGVSGMTVALQQQRFPLDQDFTQVATARTGRDGGYLFTIPALWSTTSYRVVTQTQAVATSPVATAYSAVKVGAGARHRTRTLGARRGIRPARRARHRVAPALPEPDRLAAGEVQGRRAGRRGPHPLLLQRQTAEEAGVRPAREDLAGARRERARVEPYGARAPAARDRPDRRAHRPAPGRPVRVGATALDIELKPPPRPCRRGGGPRIRARRSRSRPCRRSTGTAVRSVRPAPGAGRRLDRSCVATPARRR